MKSASLAILLCLCLVLAACGGETATDTGSPGPDSSAAPPAQAPADTVTAPPSDTQAAPAADSTAPKTNQPAPPAIYRNLEVEYFMFSPCNEFRAGDPEILKQELEGDLLTVELSLYLNCAYKSGGESGIGVEHNGEMLNILFHFTSEKEPDCYCKHNLRVKVRGIRTQPKTILLNGSALSKYNRP